MFKFPTLLSPPGEKRIRLGIPGRGLCSIPISLLEELDWPTSAFLQQPKIHWGLIISIPAIMIGVSIGCVSYFAFGLHPVYGALFATAQCPFTAYVSFSLRWLTARQTYVMAEKRGNELVALTWTGPPDGVYGAEVFLSEYKKPSVVDVASGSFKDEAQGLFGKPKVAITIMIVGFLIFLLVALGKDDPPRPTDETPTQPVEEVVPTPSLLEQLRNADSN